MIGAHISNPFNALLVLRSLSRLKHCILDWARSNASRLTSLSLLHLVVDRRWYLLFILKIGVRTHWLEVLLQASFVRVLLVRDLKVIVLMLLNSDRSRTDTISPYTCLCGIIVARGNACWLPLINWETTSFQYWRSLLPVGLYYIIWKFWWSSSKCLLMKTTTWKK